MSTKISALLAEYKFYAIFAAIVVCGFSFAFIVMAGYYPIAMVNGSTISAKAYNMEYAAANSYYSKVLQKYGAQAFGGKELSPADIRSLAMQKLIEDILINGGAATEAGADLSALVQTKLQSSNINGDLMTAAATLYGLSENDFRNLVLIPQAKRDVLSGRLFLKGQKIEDWLASAEKLAKVSIFSNQFKWNGANVQSL